MSSNTTMAIRVQGAESDDLLEDAGATFVVPPQSQSWKKAVAATGALLLVAGVGSGAAILHHSAAATGTNGFQGKAGALAKPPRDACAAVDEDCMDSGCCNIVGMTCFESTAGKGQCMKSCDPEKYLCTQPKGITEKIYWEADWQGSSLYCFSVVQQDHGSDKPHYDLQLLQGAYDKKVGIFACGAWGIFSDQDGEVAPGVPLLKMEDTDNDFKFAKRKNEGTWINTGLHSQAWKAIQAAGEYKSADWVVKVDCDAVVIPSRLANWLQSRAVPANGIYLENCKYVKYGYFGSLEIFSLKAFETLLDNIDSCKQTLDWKVGIEGGKYGPMGEDLFAQACLDSHGVRRGEAFDSHTDGMCEADRPKDQKKNKKWHPTCDETNTAGYHPLKTPEDWWACWEATTKAFGY